MNYKISIIIPMYNNEEFISECIDSLLNQTFSHFEIIIVDDGSRDNSFNIAKEYENKYDFIKVLQQENQYAGVARNLGMKHATGEYLLFLDSDDFFEPMMLEKTYQKATKTDSEVVLFSGKKYDNKSGTYKGFRALLRKEFLPSREVFSALDEDIYIYQITTPCPWTKLFKKSFIDKLGLQFSDTKNSNDYYFTTVALAYATRISYIYEVFVNYRINNNKSLQSNEDAYNSFIIDILNQTYDELETRNLFKVNIMRSFRNSAAANIVTSFKKIKTVDDKINFYNTKLKKILEKFSIFNFDENYYFLEVERMSFKYLKGIETSVKWVENRAKYLIPEHNEIVQKSKFSFIPKISIIIPVYNVENYIVQTLDSIANQSLKEIEIICVDDGSTDKSLDIIIEYAKKDNRISIIKQNNQGPSIARNTGVNIAQGKYIYFIDSDDLIKDDSLRIMFDICNEDSLDLLYFDAEVFFENEDLTNKHENIKYYYQRDKNDYEIVSGVKLLVEFIENNEYLASPCLQIINREFFINNDCWFYPGILHEDNLYTYKAIIAASKVKHVNEQFYLRRIRENSIMTIDKNFNHVYGYFICFREMSKIFENLENISELEMNNLTIPIRSVINSARRIFSELEFEERMIIDFLPVKENFLFRNNIADLSHITMKLHEEIIENKKMRKTNKKLLKNLEKIKGHPIIKMGKIIKGIVKK